MSSHVLKRMVDRRFTEVELRSMIQAATGLREDESQGRWIVETAHDSRNWEVIVEPNWTEEFLVVITAYPVETP